MNSSAVYIAIWIGAAKVGVASALVNASLRKESLINAFLALEGKGILVGEELRSVFEEIDVSSRVPAENIWFIDEKASTPNTGYTSSTDSQSSWNRSISDVPSQPPPPLPRIKNPREHLLYLYTSGTTGMPKAAIITKLRLIGLTSGIRYSFNIKRSDVLYICLPLYHTAGGLTGAGQMLLHGTSLAIRNKFSASQFWNDCIKYQCTVIQYIGEICRYLLAQPPKPTDTQHRVRLAFGNGLRKDTWVKFQKRFNIREIGEFFGATESNTSITNVDGKVGAVGFIPQLIKGVYPLRIVQTDPDTMELIRDPVTGFCIETRPMEPGQLLGRVNHTNPLRMFDGYVNKQATDSKLVLNAFKRGDMWFASGDMMYVDEFGYMYFVDRLGDTFRWHGENVATSEVEDIISSVFGNRTLTVYGVSIPGTEGRAGMVAIVLESDEYNSKTEEEFLEKLYTNVGIQLPPYARPVFVRFCQQIESTATYKLKKTSLVQMGYDPSANDDHVYLLDSANKKYTRMNADLFEKVNKGEIRL